MYYADRERIQEKTLQCRERNPPGNSYRSRIWETDKWYEHEPNKVIENKRNTRYGIFDTYIDREIYVSRADKENKNCYIFDQIPKGGKNWYDMYRKTTSNYKNLIMELQRPCKVWLKCISVVYRFFGNNL